MSSNSKRWIHNVHRNRDYIYGIDRASLQHWRLRVHIDQILKNAQFLNHFSPHSTQVKATKLGCRV